MEIIYKSSKIKDTCESVKAATKFFSGDKILARSLLSRINALKESDTLKDIVVQKQFRFHKLQNKNGKDYEGYFAIDVRTSKQPWRLIIEPLDDNKEPFNPCDIDKIVGNVRIVGVKEVSNHYA